MKKTQKQIVEEAVGAHVVLDQLGVADDSVPLAQRIRALAARRSGAGPADKLLTSHELAAEIQMDPSSVVKWANDGLLKAYRTPGKHRRFKLSDAVAFMREHGMFIPPGLGA